MRSMTGYGRRSLARDGREMTVEVKTVNHRFLDVALRMPRHLGFAEDQVRRQLSETLSRGHADVSVQYRNTRPDARRVTCDPALAAAYRDAMAALSAATGARNDVPLSQYALLPDVLTVTENEENQEAVSALLSDTLALALQDVQVLRSREGEALKADLTVHLELLEKLRLQIAERAPGVVEDYRQRLLQRIQELGVVAPDESRVVQEVALFADRAAIDEELSRLDSHIRQAYRLMEESPCGSKLNFLVQEMNREVNTIGSKALDSAIAKLVVDAKSEIEKLREQIQNVE
ncbi:MAG: YicC family protein [Clostridia bacterium]|nr:YicC family protein [Clostridia bacterium]